MTNKEKELEEGLNKLSKSMREIYNSSDDTFKFVTDSIRKELIEEFEKMIDNIRIDEDMPNLKEHIEVIKEELKQQLQELKNSQETKSCASLDKSSSDSSPDIKLKEKQ